MWAKRGAAQNASHVISISFIALHSTHTALQLPQSPLLPCRRNISFSANSCSLKRRKFHVPQTAPYSISKQHRLGLAGNLKMANSDTYGTAFRCNMYPRYN